MQYIDGELNMTHNKISHKILLILFLMLFDILLLLYCSYGTNAKFYQFFKDFVIVICATLYLCSK